VKLKDPLCKVHANNANFIHGCSLLQVTLQTSLWHIAMPSGGGIHSITSQWQSTNRVHAKQLGCATLTSSVAPLSQRLRHRVHQHKDPHSCPICYIDSLKSVSLVAISSKIPLRSLEFFGRNQKPSPLEQVLSTSSVDWLGTDRPMV
jgi:hypothetical protein